MPSILKMAKKNTNFNLKYKIIRRPSLNRIDLSEMQEYARIRRSKLEASDIIFFHIQRGAMCLGKWFIAFSLDITLGALILSVCKIYCQNVRNTE